MTDYPPTALGLSGQHVGRRVRITDGATVIEGVLWSVWHDAIKVTDSTYDGLPIEHLTSVEIIISVGDWHGTVWPHAKVEALA
jgi:hypothetical protein